MRKEAHTTFRSYRHRTLHAKTECETCDGLNFSATRRDILGLSFKLCTFRLRASKKLGLWSHNLDYVK